MGATLIAEGFGLFTAMNNPISKIVSSAPMLKEITLRFENNGPQQPTEVHGVLSGKRTMNPSRFGIRTLGSVWAFIVSLSPMSLLSERM